MTAQVQARTQAFAAEPGLRSLRKPTHETFRLPDLPAASPQCGRAAARRNVRQRTYFFLAAAYSASSAGAEAARATTKCVRWRVVPVATGAHLMKHNAIVCAVLAMSLGAAGPAFAQRDQDQQRTYRDGQQSRERGNNQRNQRGADQRSERGAERGAGPDHRFHRGDRLPAEYRNRTYVVDDWRGHRLSAPPRGYHWVQVGGDYVLAAIATGVILQLLLNN